MKITNSCVFEFPISCGVPWDYVLKLIRVNSPIAQGHEKMLPHAKVFDKNSCAVDLSSFFKCVQYLHRIIAKICMPIL